MDYFFNNVGEMAKLFDLLPSLESEGQIEDNTDLLTSTPNSSEDFQEIE